MADEPVKPKRKSPLQSMRKDLQFVYRELGGKQHLLELAREDEKFLKTLLTEQLRLEVREDEIRAAQKQGPKQNTVFIIKGLTKESEDSLSIAPVPEEVLRMRSSLFPIESNLIEETHEEEEDGAAD